MTYAEEKMRVLGWSVVFVAAFVTSFGGVVMLKGVGAETSTGSKSGMNKAEVATLGGGCFWCLEAVFERIPGVKTVTSGYAGGTVPNPTYKQVCTGTTGHAEVVQVEFDPSVVTYADVLHTFWECHDPTTLNRQGADVGTQYRSVIFYNNDQQKMIAEQSRSEAQKESSDPIVTEIQPLKTFYKAEDYHQQYFDNNQNAPYCTFVIKPKLKKLNLK
jgi:peptide-methionine (S)-S-oxide reductase